MEHDHIHLGETDGTVECVGLPASFPVVHHIERSPRLHIGNKSAETDRSAEKAARSAADSREREKLAGFSLGMEVWESLNSYYPKAAAALGNRL